MNTELIIATLINIIQYKGKYLTPAELEVLIDLLTHFRQVQETHSRGKP